MHLFDRHILPLGWVLVLLFFVANAGITVVQFHCTMQDMGCCAPLKQEMADACGMMDQPQTSSGPSVSSGEQCHSWVVAGGLKTDPTVVEKTYAHRGISVDLAYHIVPTNSIPVVDSYTQTHNFLASSSVSPPPVEKYVLASSFLI